ncbi:FAD-dependent oxidoreductase [Aphanothece hegewaldii CCALA 016]|uniref:NADH:ubiquinone reductase (non-electrogenic) n=1 Tax=Aphanothece hegewaldii CCALA 016 TaxID=2107694 RepID=A0A2T1LXU5_9CHRO|nr:NAD(P)/FAD-dependent oxidoreductase [Aphanothece hegewaldii]PSF37178.1 FAD-dependent oxidoreductase [Aphanothece hegewaldii CCALA 016]
MNQTNKKPQVVIIGGGFAGLNAAKALKNAPVDVTLIDKRNFHLFQPLLYQVATGTLSPADISTPLRLVLRNHRNTQVILDEVIDLDPDAQQVILNDHPPVPYDTLIVATGVSHHYFGNDHWKAYAPGLKTVEDAVNMRRQIFAAFEAAEKESDPEQQKAWLTFVIVGGGPTGVELAGAITEIANSSLKGDYRRIDPGDAEIILIEGLDRLLPPYTPDLSEKAEKTLVSRGVTVMTKAMVTDIKADLVTVKVNDEIQQISAKTVLWAAGVKASKMGEIIAQRAQAKIDRSGRVMVESDLSVAGYPNLFVIGDLANFSHQGDKPLPGVAPVAVQEGKYIAKLIQKRLIGETLEPFTYSDAGSLAVIGQNAAVIDLKFIHLSGFIAWFIWVWAHIYYLIEFDNKLIVMLEWGWNYFTHGRGARLITGEASSDLASLIPDTSYEPSINKVESPATAKV